VLYWIIKPFVAIFFRVFYQYDYRGRHNIPKGRPVVLAPNHVNAFIDPVALGLLSPAPVRFFARGDVFKGKLAKRVLNSMGVSPMYRIQEGFSEIKKNDKTFEECRSLLTSDKIILLFPEGLCVQERRLRPLKKGMARIVFQTEEILGFEKDVLVIPVGLNYTAPYKFRSKLFIDIGEPISAIDYKERYLKDKVRTINEFTKMFEAKMAEHMVVLNNTESDKLFVSLEEIYMYQWLKDKGQDVKELESSYFGSKELAEMINYMDATNPELSVSLRKKTTEYIRRLRQNGLRDHLLRPENIESISLGTFIRDYLIIVFGMPVYLIALILHYLPYFIAKKVCDKKIRNIEFFASVYANLAMIIWIIYASIQVLTVALVFRDWFILSAYTAVFLPLTGFFALWYYPVKEKIFGRWRLLRMVRKERKIVEELVNERFEIISEVERSKREFKDHLKTLEPCNSEV
jgi:glycerol-3-phosphate O-acyltransferase/dihydroxyacetone phosphate acyltransferase